MHQAPVQRLEYSRCPITTTTTITTTISRGVTTTATTTATPLLGEGHPHGCEASE